MFVSNSICAIVATFLFAVAQGQTITPSTNMAGYTPRYLGGVDSYLLKDLIQQAFEVNFSSGDCTDFLWAANHYHTDPGASYLQNIPTYTVSPSKEWGEYTACTGDDHFYNEWIVEAFNRYRTNFPNGRANADFKAAFFDPIPYGIHGTHLEPGDGGCVGYEESVLKATRYMLGYIESVQLMQKAIAEAAGCNFPTTPCTTSIEAWDASVAIYVGSLEGSDGNNCPTGCYGNTLYSLADEMCDDFKTCGIGDASGVGLTIDKNDPAQVNTRILSFYAAGSLAAEHGSHINMEYWKRRIAAKMTVPMVQGVFKYGYRLSDGGSGTDIPSSQLDKDVAKAGTFAMMAGPKLWACSKKGYNKQQNELKIGGPIVGTGVASNFQNIKLAYECNYKCLGISCLEVGSLYDGDPKPKSGANACDDKENGSSFDFVCKRQKKARKEACKAFKKKAGVRKRDRSNYFLGEYEDLESEVFR